MKRSVILTDRLGPDILLVLTMKRQVLQRERAHLKVPGCSLVLSALLTKITKNDAFDCVIMRMESEGEWNSVILIFL